MGHHKQKSESHAASETPLQRKTNQAGSGPSGVGGREFGQVIEPMQAQMASGNRGLAADFGESAKKKTKSRKKAA